ncbi:ABC transporter ATP-binding protein [Halobacillus salinus]|uniref:ABC transporter ATP-binding protein n=1 Tax=Halobacillus salinus TaxID=192814 RepID=A0A4Z0GT80_9BACI|nr:ABC transporter ATP-binding protein [Halobacillus salinus]TGB00762.1 ABC transporter ATP-binding protein [Halobacillus salinus]
MKVELRGVRKVFGDTKALDGVDVHFEENKFYGLLGKNGAGKTTLMQLLAGHTLPTAGEVLLDGEAPFNNRDALKRVCLINESSNFKRRLKVKDVLKIASLFYPNWSRETAEYLMEKFNLKPGMSTRGLSKGMESALGIIIGLSARADVTIFDEPYIGLDASARYMFYDLLLEEFEEHPRTFILSTHLIDEVSRLFEEVVVLKEGEVLFQETAELMIEKSLKVSGTKEKVDAFTKGKTVIEESEMMGMKSALVYGEVLQLEDAKAFGLEAERSSMQTLMVHLTDQKEEKYA